MTGHPKEPAELCAERRRIEGPLKAKAPFADACTARACAPSRPQSKEAEAARLSGELRSSKEKEAVLTRDLTAAKASLVSVQGMVRDMQATNDDLLVRLEALEVAMRSKVRSLAHYRPPAPPPRIGR